jgi:hypothetical protein
MSLSDVFRSAAAGTLFFLMMYYFGQLSLNKRGLASFVLFTVLFFVGTLAFRNILIP